jgi:hypothetical protein
MIVGGLDDRDIQIGNARKHTRRDRDAARAAADDNNIVAFRWPLGRRRGLGGGRRRRQTRSLGGERDAPSAAAIGQNGLWQLGDRRFESRDVLVRHLPRDNRHIAALKTQVCGFPRDSGERRLIGCFSVGAITEDRPEARRFRLGDVGQRELRACG